MDTIFTKAVLWIGDGFWLCWAQESPLSRCCWLSLWLCSVCWWYKTLRTLALSTSVNVLGNVFIVLEQRWGRQFFFQRLHWTVDSQPLTDRELKQRADCVHMPLQGRRHYFTFPSFKKKQDKLTKQGVGQESCAIGTLQLLVPSKQAWIPAWSSKLCCVHAFLQSSATAKPQFLHPQQPPSFPIVLFVSCLVLPSLLYLSG